jgi:hypothetical protein
MVNRRKIIMVSRPKQRLKKMNAFVKNVMTYVAKLLQLIRPAKLKRKETLTDKKMQDLLGLT